MRSSPEVYEPTPEAKAVLERLHALVSKDIIIEDEFFAIKKGLRSSVTPEYLVENQDTLQALQEMGKNSLAQDVLFHNQTLRVNHEPESNRPVVQLPTLKIRYFKLCEVGVDDQSDVASHRFFVGEVHGRQGLYLKRIPELASISGMRRSRLPTETDIGYGAEYFAIGADEPAQWQQDPSNIFVPKLTTVEIPNRLVHRQGLLKRAGEWASQIVVGHR